MIEKSSVDIAELDIADFRSIFVETNIGEIGISQTADGVRISLSGKNMVMKMHGENSFTLKEDK